MLLVDVPATLPVAFASASIFDDVMGGNIAFMNAVPIDTNTNSNKLAQINRYVLFILVQAAACIAKAAERR